MAIKALNLDAQHRFVSKTDPDYDPDGNHGPNATVFLLGTLDSIQVGILQDEMTTFRQGSGMTINNGENSILAARMALQGWENFEGTFESKKETLRRTPYVMATTDTVRQIPFPVVEEIADFVRSGNTIDEDTEKNSVSASSPSSLSEASETAEPAPSEQSNDGGAKPKGKSTTKAK